MAIEPEQKTPPLNERRITVPPMLPAKASPKRVRLFFLDNLRVMLILLVIAGHLAATYSGSDVWYYYEPTKDEVASIILNIFGVTVQAFTMDLFFLIAGYLTPRAYDRKGAAQRGGGNGFLSHSQLSLHDAAASVMPHWPLWLRSFPVSHSPLHGAP